MHQLEETSCPLCVEEYTQDDKAFLPCSCGYKVCMFCWHTIRENFNGLCPACRVPYISDPSTINRNQDKGGAKSGSGNKNSSKQKNSTKTTTTNTATNNNKKKKKGALLSISSSSASVIIETEEERARRESLEEELETARVLEIIRQLDLQDLEREREQEREEERQREMEQEIERERQREMEQEIERERRREMEEERERERNIAAIVAEKCRKEAVTVAPVIESKERPEECQKIRLCAVCSVICKMQCPCREVFYCTQEHQRAHWKSHKSRCSASSRSSKN